MATKIITLDNRFATGEPTVQVVASRGRTSRVYREAFSLQKIAATQDAESLQFAESVEPQEGKTVVLIIGLGGGETYGPNRNGDSFPAAPIPGMIEPHEVLPKHYKSYENAHVFEHHVNKDPAKAIGRVLKAFWNPKMQRVEVVEEIDNEKAPHIVERIRDGEFPAKSMGARLAYDVCAICGNKAPNPRHYCDHLKFQMNNIDSEGKIACALNPSPVFFDSSFVIRPADRTGYMMKKIAHETLVLSAEQGAIVEHLKGKLAAATKISEIEKEISGKIDAAASNDGETITIVKKFTDNLSPSVPDGHAVVTELAKYPVKDVVETCDKTGMQLCDQDLIAFFHAKLGGEQMPPKVYEECTRHLKVSYELFKSYPSFLAELSDKIEGGEFNQKIANTIVDKTKRDLLPPSMYPEARANTDVLTYTDPSGDQWKTNYHQVRQTHDKILERTEMERNALLAARLGLATLLGGAALTNKITPNAAVNRALLGGAALGGGASVMDRFSNAEIEGPMLTTDQGETISALTQMQRMPTKMASELRYVVRRNPSKGVAPLSSSDTNKILASAEKLATVTDNITGKSVPVEGLCEIIGSSILKPFK